MTPRRQRRPLPPPSILITILLPALLAAALAASQLTTRSLWLDEGASVAIASQHGAALWRAIAHDGGNMLVYYLLLHLLIALFGAGEWLIRLPSVLATAATAGIVAALGLRLFDRRVALTAAVLVAVSVPLIYWGQNARGYALMATFAGASFLAFVVVIDGPENPRALVAYGVTTLVAIYLSFDAILIVPAQLVVLLARRERARAVLAVVAVVALACIPLLLLALQRGSGQLFWVPHLSASVLNQTAVTLTSAGMPPNFHATATTTVTLIVTGVIVLGALIAVRRADWRAGLVAAWLVVPAVLAVLASAAGEPLELARISVLLMPAIALLAAWGLGLPSVPSLAGWAGVAGLILLRALQLGPSYGTSPEDWKSATNYVLAAEHSGDCVAFYPEDGRMPFDYYVRGRAAAAALTPVLPALPWQAVRPFVERYSLPAAARLSRIASRCPRLWLLASHQGQRRGPPASRRNYAGYESLLGALGRRYGAPGERSFGYAAEIQVALFHH